LSDKDRSPYGINKLNIIDRLRAAYKLLIEEGRRKKEERRKKK
jgi:hypothetical protein